MKNQFGFVRGGWFWWVKLISSVSLAIGVFLGLATLLSSGAYAAENEKPWWVEAQAVSGKNNPSKVILWYEKDLTDHFGFYAYIWKESMGYREFVVGPTWKPFEGLQLGVGLGREAQTKDYNAVQRSTFVDWTVGKVNTYGAFEKGGGSGRWHKVTVTYAMSEQFGGGVMDESLLGRGPRLEYNITKSVQVWGAVLHDHDTRANTSMLAVNVSF